jgi:hypothetical protein
VDTDCVFHISPPPKRNQDADLRCTGSRGQSLGWQVKPGTSSCLDTSNRTIRRGKLIADTCGYKVEAAVRSVAELLARDFSTGV